MNKKSIKKILTMIFCCSVIFIINMISVFAKESKIIDISETKNVSIMENNENVIAKVNNSLTEEDTTYFTVDNVEYQILSENTVAIWDATSVSGVYQIPSQVSDNGITYSVVEIGCKAFDRNTELTTIIMPDTVVKIQDGRVLEHLWRGAFKECTSLKSITFSKNLTYIGRDAFDGDIALANVKLPEKLETIEETAFDDCSGITELTIPSSVTYVGQHALSGTSLVTFTIPKNTMVNDSALAGISTLTDIYVESGNSRYCSVDGVMYDANMTWVICYPSGKKNVEYILPEQVTTIRASTFSKHAYLKKLVLNNKINVRGLGTGVLQGSNVSAIEVPEDNPYLKSVDGVLFTKDGQTLLLYPPAKEDAIYFVPSGTINIGEPVFYSFETCKNLEELYVPASVEKIDGTMWNSEKLKQVVFASTSNLTSIGGATFQECKALESICFPASIQSFSDEYFGNEFFWCENLKILYVAPGAGIYNCEYFGTQTLEWCYQLTVYGEGASNSLSKLAERFNKPYQDVSEECDKVLGITFQDTVRETSVTETISLNAVVYPKVKENESLTYTSSDNSIATVDANGNVTGISCGTCYITAMSQDGAYARCQVQVEHTYGTPVFNWSEDGKSCTITYTCANDATHVNSQPCTVTTKVKTEATCTTKGITIYTATYGSDTDTKEVQDIPLDASNHEGKTEVRNAKKATYTEKGYTGDVYCVNCNVVIKRGSSIDILVDTTVKKGTSFSKGGLKYKVTGASIVTVTGLSSKTKTSVTIPETVAYNGRSFKITAISSKSFYKNTKITKVKIGKNIKKIGTSAFQGCTKLKTLTIGTAVTSIGSKAFYGSKKLTTITINSKKLKIVEKNALKGIKQTATIKVPASKLKSYKKLLKGKGQGNNVKIKKI